jgi:hypothetical protein
VKWKVLSQNQSIKEGSACLEIPPGEMKSVDAIFTTPSSSGDIQLMVEAWKDGVQRYVENRMVFNIGEDQ